MFKIKTPQYPTNFFNRSIYGLKRTMFQNIKMLKYNLFFPVRKQTTINVLSMPDSARTLAGEVIQLLGSERREEILSRGGGGFQCLECEGSLILKGGRSAQGPCLHFAHLAVHEGMKTGCHETTNESKLHKSAKNYIAANIKQLTLVTNECPACGKEETRSFLQWDASIEGKFPGLPYKFDVLLKKCGGTEGDWQAIEVSQPIIALAETVNHFLKPICSGSTHTQGSSKEAGGSE